MEKLKNFTTSQLVNKSEMGLIKGGLPPWSIWKFQAQMTLCDGTTGQLMQEYTWWGNYGTQNTEIWPDD